jgi:predicted CXXCH cytochrome family protein
MQSANEHSVLGDFNDHTFAGQRGRTHFRRKAGGFWVSTTGADGELADYPVAYTFGVEPLQQYLLALPGGRLQAFDVAWDTQKKQWFELYPGQQIKHDDALHWTGPNQNANFMCIECHATGFKRNYDPLADHYASTWQALGVGCQSCHGPAAGHLEWVKRPTEETGYGFSSVGVGDSARREAEVCGRCHSRRAALADGYQHANRLMDDFLPSILSPVLNEIDGKIKDEVFEYGSFVQSRMYAAGVRCSDCHDPHSAELRAEGNALCTQCHNPSGQAIRPGIDSSGLISKNYDSPEHHRHQQETAAAQCISCHMPARNFMVNDLRHDHSFSVPNPAQAMKLGHSDACVNCHQDMSDADLVEQFRLRFDNPLPRDGGYAMALFKARRGKAGAAEALLKQLARPDHDLAAIRRATLLTELPRYPSVQAQQMGAQALKHVDPQVREVAVNSLENLADEVQKLKWLGPLLHDPVRAVRIAAAWQLAQISPGLVAGLNDFQPAINEYEQVQLALLERPESYLNLAMLFQLRGRDAQVEPALRMALQRDGKFQPARLLLAQWLELRAEPEKAEKLLREGIAHDTKAADLYHALAMHLIRRGQRDEAWVQLERAYELTRDSGHYAYAYAVGLYEAGRVSEALSTLDAHLLQNQMDRFARESLLIYAQHADDQGKIRSLIHDLKSINPTDPLLQRAW